MEIKTLLFGCGDLLLGLLALCLQVYCISYYILKTNPYLNNLVRGIIFISTYSSCKISTYALYGTGNPSDAASVGIWGGVCFILTATFILSYRLDRDKR